MSNVSTKRYEEARTAIRQHIHAEKDEEVVFTKGATEGLNLIASGYGDVAVHENDVILVSEMEHHSNLVPWQALCKRKKACLKIIPLLDNGLLDMETYKKSLSDRVKIVAAGHVSNALGTVNPVKRIAELAHECRAVAVIDGTQAVQHCNVDVRELDCDFYCFSGHKMYGPTGIGVMYGKKELLDNIPPYQYGGEMVDEVGLYSSSYAKPPLRFEAGTPDYIGAIALHEAINYIENIGIDEIAAHENHVTDYAMECLGRVEGIRIFGENIPRVSIISFLIDELHPYDVAVLLDKFGIAVRAGRHCAQPVMDHYGINGTLRISIACYNTKEEIDALCEALKYVCRLLKR